MPRTGRLAALERAGDPVWLGDPLEAVAADELLDPPGALTAELGGVDQKRVQPGRTSLACALVADQSEEASAACWPLPPTRAEAGVAQSPSSRARNASNKANRRDTCVARLGGR